MKKMGKNSGIKTFIMLLCPLIKKRFKVFLKPEVLYQLKRI